MYGNDFSSRRQVDGRALISPEPQMTVTDIMRIYHLDRRTVARYIGAGLLKPAPKPVGIKRDKYFAADVMRVFGGIEVAVV